MRRRCGEASAGTGEIDHDGKAEDEERPRRNGQVEVVVEEQTVNGFVDDPDGGEEHQAGFYKGRKGLDFAVAIAVVLVGRAVGDLDGGRG